MIIITASTFIAWLFPISCPVRYSVKQDDLPTLPNLYRLSYTVIFRRKYILWKVASCLENQMNKEILDKKKYEFLRSPDQVFAGGCKDAREFPVDFRRKLRIHG